MGLIEKRQRDWSKNTDEGPMDMNNGVEIDYGSGQQAGWRGRGKKEEKLDKCNSINNETLKKKKPYFLVYV